ncbi:MAG: MFS transporter [Gammaproteobacteria bacterium]|nr:MFS transporter [Gammaproteobacteria bacterium]
MLAKNQNPSTGEPSFSVDVQFVRALESGDLPAPGALTLEEAGLSPAQLVEMFESQVLSRQLDLHSRRLQARGESFYTIGSSGHEGNAAVAAALRLGDPAFLHYRSGAFFIQRSRQLPGSTPTWDLLLSFCASSEDPIAGGRHKVFGSRALNVPPQTSTIASQLPKAVGAAHSLGLARRLGVAGPWPSDSVILCSFGDASFNHSTAQGAINAAAWTAFQGLPMPLVFLCEDNGLGISVPTPPGWIENSMRARAGIEYLACNGLDPLDTYRAASRAAAIARRQKKPVFLHLRCVRLLGHAGADAQQAYLSAEQIAAAERDDPLLHGAARLLHLGLLSADEVLNLYRDTGARVRAVAEEAIKRPKLLRADEVMASIVPPPRTSRAVAAALPPDDGQPKPMGRLLNQALDRMLLRYPHMFLAGEDVGRKGGVYGVTQRLQARHGAHRVIDTLLDEQSILGLGIGAAHNGLLPVVEIQFLAYLHNAEDQLRGEAATLPFFSQGQFTNPMVVRIAGLAYQRGFGGHFHNDNAIAVLRDIPGLPVACPSNGADAVGLLQEALRLADEEQRVVVLIEPIALYHQRDLRAAGDDGACSVDPGPDFRIPVGRFGRHGDGRDLALVSYGNGAYLCRQAWPALEAAGIRPRLIDLRWLTGLDHDALHAELADCARILVVDECRRSGSLSEELLANLAERGIESARLRRLTAQDSFIPLGRAATATLPSAAGIVAAATAWCRS